MFLTFFSKELAHGFKRPMVYVFFVVIGLLVFGAVTSEFVQIGGAVGNVNENSPFVLANYVTTLSIFGLLIAAAFFNNAALRDYKHGFNEILFSTPLSKFGYFFGRFCGALVLACVPLCGIYFGLLIGIGIGVPAGWIQGDSIGPLNFGAYINTFLLFILPNMLLAGAITFSLANKWKSTVISFVGIIIVMMGYIISGTLLSDLENEVVGALSDPFGIRTYSIVTKYYTPAEKNTLIPSFSGIMLTNRLIYIGLSIGILILSYFSFSFRTQGGRKKKKAEGVNPVHETFEKPALAQLFNSQTSWLQFKSFFIVDFVSMLRSTTFVILFIFMLVLTVANLSGGFEYFGLQSYPVTYKMVDVVGAGSSLFVIIILVFFSGELVWRARESKIAEVIDATPHNSMPALVAKTSALFVLACGLYLFNILVGMGYQLLNGYTKFELDVYLGDFFYNYLPLYLVTCTLLVFIQVVVNHKYIGYFVSILYLFVIDLLWLVFDLNSNMLSIGSTPSMQYSDMNGFGPAVTSNLWFNAYWISFGILLLLAAALFVRRGKIAGKEVWTLAKKNFSGVYRIYFGLFGILWLGIASYVYYNVHVLHELTSADEREEQAVAYERTYKKYEKVAQPKLVHANYFIDIFPSERDVMAEVEIDMVNTTNEPIDSLHFTISEDWNHEILIEGSEQVLNDEDFGYQIYELAETMQPGDTLKMRIKGGYITEGFENEVSNLSVIENGTFLNNFSILPTFGYNANFELSDKDKRKEYDLPEKVRTPKLVADCGPLCDINYLSDGKSDWVEVETVISTASDQLAVAPGSLVEEWSEDGRNYFRYRVDHPSQNFFAFISARYEVARKKWNGIDIEVYYDEKHDYNIDMMLEAVEKSLKYYTENFGPYYHKQARIIEFPRYATFAQAFPGTMPYSESFGFIIDLESAEDNNVIDAVIAHEMAHQWWAHQEVSANMQGGTMLTESFSEYSSLMVMKDQVGPVKMKEFLKYDLDRYLQGRSAERIKELPLYKVENQAYIHYGKGSVILYALQDYIGEEKVNNAMRNFLEEFKYSTPYPTSLDFLGYLEPEVPDSLQYLIDDWFKQITLYDNRLMAAEVEEMPNGKFNVSLDIEAYKVRADTLGNETRIAWNDWVDVGFFADADEEELIMEQRVKFDTTNFKMSFELDQRPVKAAIDPRRILIERVYSDNVKRVTEKE